MKNGVRKVFSEKAAQIAIESYGWSEMIPLEKPIEIGKKTLPPPIKLIQPPELLKAKEPDPIQNLSKETEVKKIEVKEVKRRTRKK